MLRASGRFPVLVKGSLSRSFPVVGVAAR